ncbi:MAG TPA: hypothetical protein VMJ10_00250 [Kofleriaceae bacterium]|nr:hypothetical protein [Kofleriaceae bacterium]
MIAATGAVLTHTCIELIDPRPGFGRVATWLGTILIVASHVIVTVGLTWTTVSISALGTAVVAFVAHLQRCESRNVSSSLPRGAIYGLLFVAGFALREAAVAAAAVALFPLLVWIGINFVRRRHLPRPAAVMVFFAPFAIVAAAQSRIPQLRGAEYDEFNEERGRISDSAAFMGLDKRAPELLSRAGWTVDEFNDFEKWLLADDTEFSTEKVRRLADTGGVPRTFGLAESLDVLHGIARDSAASVWLFLTAIAGGIALAWLGVIDRRTGIWFGLGNLVFLAIVPVAMAALNRFPLRLSLSFYTVAAFGMFALLAGEIASRPPRTESNRRGDIVLLVILLFALAWGRSLVRWLRPEPFSYHRALREFADRVKARNGIIMVTVGITELDPLLPDPRGYDALPSGWGTFTGIWWEYIERFGIHSGNELLHKMIDNPNAYMVALPYGHDTFEEWFRRRLHNPSIRMALVDSAEGMPTANRSELYRLVTTPLVRGSDEWQRLARNESLANEELPGPPDTSDDTFRAITLTAPYQQHVLSFRDAKPGSVVEAVDGGLRCTVAAVAGDPCATLGQSSERAGVHIAVHGLAAARFDLALIEPENIVGVYITAQTDTSRSVRWRWVLDEAAQRFGFSGTITLVPGYPAHQLELVGTTASSQDIRDLRVWVEVKPGTHAGFELRRVEVAER